MRAETLADFFRELGLRTIQTPSCFWYSPQRFQFTSIPFHRKIEPGTGELLSLMARGPALALRYPAHAAGPSNGGLYVCDDRGYDLHTLSSKSRNQTRRGLERCEVGQIDFRYLAEVGYPLLEDTSQRQTGNASSISPSLWKRMCELGERTADFEAWGAFVEGRLSAFIVGFLIEDCYHLYLQKSATRFLAHYPNNAVVFKVVKDKLSQPDVSYVSYGRKALAASAGLDHFKSALGFRIRPCTEKVVFNPLLQPIVAGPGNALVRRVARRYPDSLFWQRVLKAIELGRHFGLGS